MSDEEEKIDLFKKPKSLLFQTTNLIINQLPKKEKIIFPSSSVTSSFQDKIPVISSTSSELDFFKLLSRMDNRHAEEQNDLSNFNSLAEKYRPQSFSECFEDQHKSKNSVTQFLMNKSYHCSKRKYDRVADGMIIHGPCGSGKTAFINAALKTFQKIPIYFDPDKDKDLTNKKERKSDLELLEEFCEAILKSYLSQQIQNVFIFDACDGYLTEDLIKYFSNGVFDSSFGYFKNIFQPVSKVSKVKRKKEIINLEIKKKPSKKSKIETKTIDTHFEKGLSVKTISSSNSESLIRQPIKVFFILNNIFEKPGKFLKDAKQRTSTGDLTANELFETLKLENGPWNFSAIESRIIKILEKENIHFPDRYQVIKDLILSTNGNLHKIFILLEQFIHAIRDPENKKLEERFKASEFMSSIFFDTKISSESEKLTSYKNKLMKQKKYSPNSNARKVDKILNEMKIPRNNLMNLDPILKKRIEERYLISWERFIEMCNHKPPLINESKNISEDYDFFDSRNIPTIEIINYLPFFLEFQNFNVPFVIYGLRLEQNFSSYITSFVFSQYIHLIQHGVSQEDSMEANFIPKIATMFSDFQFFSDVDEEYFNNDLIWSFFLPIMRTLRNFCEKFKIYSNVVSKNTNWDESRKNWSNLMSIQAKRNYIFPFRKLTQNAISIYPETELYLRQLIQNIHFIFEPTMTTNDYNADKFLLNIISQNPTLLEIPSFLIPIYVLFIKTAEKSHLDAIKNQVSISKTVDLTNDPFQYAKISRLYAIFLCVFHFYGVDPLTITLAIQSFTLRSDLKISKNFSKRYLELENFIKNNNGIVKVKTSNLFL